MDSLNSGAAPGSLADGSQRPSIPVHKPKKPADVAAAMAKEVRQRKAEACQASRRYVNVDHATNFVGLAILDSPVLLLLLPVTSHCKISAMEMVQLALQVPELRAATAESCGDAAICTCCRSGFTSAGAGWPVRPLAPAARQTHTEPMPSQADVQAQLSARQNPDPAHLDALAMPTAASAAKVRRGMPNSSDADTGWGPIENLTLAALDLASHRQPVPKERQCFTELALWLARHARSSQAPERSAPDGGTEGGMQEEGLTPQEVLHYERIAKQLLGMNHNALSALMRAPHVANTEEHLARQLWRSIPQPAHLPAVRTALICVWLPPVAHAACRVLVCKVFVGELGIASAFVGTLRA
jgi:hypothetical protein